MRELALQIGLRECGKGRLGAYQKLWDLLLPIIHVRQDKAIDNPKQIKQVCKLSGGQSRCWRRSYSMLTIMQIRRAARVSLHEHGKRETSS